MTRQHTNLSLGFQEHLGLENLYQLNFTVIIPLVHRATAYIYIYLRLVVTYMQDITTCDRMSIIYLGFYEWI